MAQGLEVLQSALAGKRVRWRGNRDRQWGEWRTAKQLANLSLWMLSEHLSDSPEVTKEIEWQIEEDLPLSEDEAWEALKRGAIVTNGTHECRMERAGDNWRKLSRPVGTTEWEKSDPTRWRIVQESNERPTREEAQAYIEDHSSISDYMANVAVTTLMQGYPGLFREEETPAPTNDTRMTVDELGEWITKYVHLNTFIVSYMVEALYEECPAMFRKEAGK